MQDIKHHEKDWRPDEFQGRGNVRAADELTQIADVTQRFTNVSLTAKRSTKARLEQILIQSLSKPIAGQQENFRPEIIENNEKDDSNDGRHRNADQSRITVTLQDLGEDVDHI